MSGKPMDYWTFFAGEAERANEPLYVRYSLGIRGDEELKAFAANAREGQPHANILFGAVHFLLLRGAEHPLKRFYRNLGGNADASVEDPFPLFRDFVLASRDALLPIVSTRVTNTNEVGRSALLHAGFRAIAAHDGEPLHLIEIGPSAGLNEIWDSYGVRYLKDGVPVAEIAPDAPLVIDCDIKGERAPPSGPTPTVASRVGLESNPVDLSDPDNRDWLKALVWPDHVARFERLTRALELAADRKPNIVAGDALLLLPDVLAGVPRDEPVCVYHTMVTYQFSAAMRAALDHILVAVGLRRPVFRLSLEGTAQGENPLLLYRYHDGVRDKRPLALCGPHGAWIEWQAP